MKTEKEIRELLQLRIEDREDFILVRDYKRAAAMNKVVQDIKWILGDEE